MSDETRTFTAPMEIAKRDDEQQMVFGWAYISKNADGTYVMDHSGDLLPITELEPAVYEYVIESRIHTDMHKRNADNDPVGSGVLVESMVFTKEKMEALGIPEGTMPEGWWYGAKITDAEAWQEVKKGNRRMFSIGIRAVREKIDE